MISIDFENEEELKEYLENYYEHILEEAKDEGYEEGEEVGYEEGYNTCIVDFSNGGLNRDIICDMLGLLYWDAEEAKERICKLIDNL